MLSIKELYIYYLVIGFGFTGSLSLPPKVDPPDVRFLGSPKGPNQEEPDPDAEFGFRKGDADPKLRCERPTDFIYRQCCVFPPFYVGKIAEKCGARTLLNFNKENITAASRLLTTNDCDHWRCVLKKYKQITEKDYVDMNRYFKHLDKWAELNPRFKAVISEGKYYCNNIFREVLPLHICRFADFNTCLRHFVKLDCPQLIPDPECYEQKQVFHECRNFFL